MHPARSPGLHLVGLLIAFLVVLIASGLAVTGPAMAVDSLLSQGKSSSTENAGTPASAVLDGKVSVSLDGVGTIRHVINTTGGPANASARVVHVNAYP
ncbi:hypothetical protein AB0O34_19495 [Sphaerisporangium sp. NPDC088356]|uniref:hypothetical protein n=1 Tax=Sphaerisporangium sp. NPDC088356 TaxID=3154871 RepID=UPI00342AD879